MAPSRHARVPLAAALLLGVALAACRTSPPAPAADEHPTWLAALITSLERQPPAGPPRAVYRYTYRDQVVYYLPPGCCDTPGVLYDAGGRHLCAPDGGFLGTGDGRCADFAAARSHEQLVWREAR